MAKTSFNQFDLSDIANKQGLVQGTVRAALPDARLCCARRIRIPIKTLNHLQELAKDNAPTATVGIYSAVEAYVPTAKTVVFESGASEVRSDVTSMYCGQVKDLMKPENRIPQPRTLLQALKDTYIQLDPNGYVTVLDVKNMERLEAMPRMSLARSERIDYSELNIR